MSVVPPSSQPQCRASRSDVQGTQVTPGQPAEDTGQALLSPGCTGAQHSVVGARCRATSLHLILLTAWVYRVDVSGVRIRNTVSSPRFSAHFAVILPAHRGQDVHCWQNMGNAGHRHRRHTHRTQEHRGQNGGNTGHREYSTKGIQNMGHRFRTHRMRGT